MNWEAAGAIGEIVGAVAVVVSLLYLALQIRTQNEESRLSAIRESAQNWSELLEKVLDPGLAAVYLKGVREGIDDMDDVEASRFAIFLNILLRFWENSYYQHRRQRLDQRLWNSIETQLSEVTTTPGFAQYWPARKHFFSAEFQSYVEGLDSPAYSDPATAMRRSQIPEI